jgi:hypothetical protein
VLTITQEHFNLFAFKIIFISIPSKTERAHQAVFFSLEKPLSGCVAHQSWKIIFKLGILSLSEKSSSVSRTPSQRKNILNHLSDPKTSVVRRVSNLNHPVHLPGTPAIYAHPVK